MSNVTTLARPYAKAAFELAEAREATGRWNEMLGLASALVSEETLAALLESPHISSSQLVELLSDTAGNAFDASFRDYLSVLAENKRFSLLPEITALYQNLHDESNKVLRVRVVSAFALEGSQASRMQDALAKRFDREIVLESEVDKSIIGGAVIYAGGQVIDGSLKDRLAKLSNSLFN